MVRNTVAVERLAEDMELELVVYACKNEDLVTTLDYVKGALEIAQGRADVVSTYCLVLADLDDFSHTMYAVVSDLCGNWTIASHVHSRPGPH